MALEALIWPLLSSTWEAKHNAAINALRTALEKQAKQDQTRDNLERYTQEIRKVLSGAAKREWQGLTDEEIGMLTIFDGLHHVETPLLAEFARTIETALKEKNG
jgi:hypothetical protein